MEMHTSGDSDSTGAVCGNIMGLIHGYEAIHAHFKEQLAILRYFYA